MVLKPDPIGVQMSVKGNGAKSAGHTQLDLRGRRTKRGLSLEQIAETTKISMRFLKAIEDEDFGQLPGGIFNTSYLKQYARAVGMDEAKLLSFYERERDSHDGGNSMSNGHQRWFQRLLRVPATANR